MYSFVANIEIIGINPFVFVPDKILLQIFEDAGQSKGHIAVCGTVNEYAFIQTLLKYKGDWRLYINTTMLPNSPKLIGTKIHVTIGIDTKDRTIEIPHELLKKLKDNKEAKLVFDNLSLSKQHEIVRYISFLKTEVAIDNNIEKAIGFLLGQNRFLGRSKP